MKRRSWWAAPTLGLACLVVAGCGPEAPHSAGSAAEPRVAARIEPWFEEVAAESGIDFHHTSGKRERFLMPEINAGGVALLDIDNDGLLDVFCVNGGVITGQGIEGPGHRLYRNLGGWRFEDVTDRAGVGANPGYGMGATVADFDGDGWQDLYVLNLLENILYRNRGDGTFEDVTATAGVAGDPSEWSSSAAFFDYDRDGHLDLYVANYIHWSLAAEVDCFSRGGTPDYCSPLSYRAPSRDRLFRNRGDGTFEDVTVAMGLDQAFGNGFGVATADFDRDGWVDVFVANDAMPNQLWMNRGTPPFRDEAFQRGCAVNVNGVPRAGMGVVVVDLLDRGWMDVFVTHMMGEGHGWFRNDRGHFTDAITPRGPMAGTRPFTGFGVAFRDFDHDGELDLYVSQGRVRLGAKDIVPHDPFAEPNVLLRGIGSGDFAEVLPAGGTDPELIDTGRGAAFGDLDNDGAEDIVIVNRDGPVHLLRNRVGGRGRWVGLDVRLPGGGVAHNAMVRASVGGRVRWRQVQPNEGVASSNDPRVVLGLGAGDAADHVLVRWLDGRVEDFGRLAAGAYHRLVRGAGTPVPGDGFW